MKYLLTLALISSLSMFAACTLAPLDGSVVNASSVTFSGESPEAGATVTIEAFDKKTNAFITIATTTSDTATNAHFADRDWFFWSKSHLDTMNPGGSCIWGTFNTTSNKCFLSPGGDTARFRVRGSGLNFLSFQKGFSECMTQHVQDGDTQARAAINCASPNSPEILLSIIN